MLHNFASGGEKVQLGYDIASSTQCLLHSDQCWYHQLHNIWFCQSSFIYNSSKTKILKYFSVGGYKFMYHFYVCRKSFNLAYKYTAKWDNNGQNHCHFCIQSVRKHISNEKIVFYLIQQCTDLIMVFHTKKYSMGYQCPSQIGAIVKAAAYCFCSRTSQSIRNNANTWKKIHSYYSHGAESLHMQFSLTPEPKSNKVIHETLIPQCSVAVQGVLTWTTMVLQSHVEQNPYSGKAGKVPPCIL